MRGTSDLVNALQDIRDRITSLEHAADLIKTVLIVKEPETVHAANAFEGLRKQVVAAAAERRSHVTQLTQMAVAVDRAADLADLRLQLQEWLNQASIAELRELPTGLRAQDFFDGVDGTSLDGAVGLDIVEPAYIDAQTNQVVRLGRARALDDDSNASADGAAIDPGKRAKDVAK